MGLPANAIVDCHTHTHFSDGAATFEENVRAAARVGCRVLVSTDHLTLPASMDPTCAVSVTESALGAHRAAFEEARALAGEIAPNLTYLYGFECDWYEGCEPLVESWSAGAVVRLGSVHWLGDPGEIAVGAASPGTDDDPAERVACANAPGRGSGWIDDREDQHIWHELGPDEVWRRYAATWCRACESPLAFDVMAHPDLAQRFCAEGLAATIDLRPLWDEMAACAHDTGRRIEISSAGIRKGVGDYYPAAGLLERFYRAGVPITFSSDAHVARDICSGVAEAQHHAYEIGYRTFDAPRADGSWETVAL
ncbi:PHP domain-containing protein [Collinsella intestinalis]|uniref:PHP domain-containing protein n=1 Tax=Collinsella intestinalis TaxID=147207 RepID=UPI00195E3620|nr:PHP domain-containing protein [Collinsella intestinalis]MBM6942311.1 hypothetical protein [Collinsella intestinalis]